MQIQINHVQKPVGLIRKTTHHSVAIKVSFSAQELAIIRERRLERDIVSNEDIHLTFLQERQCATRIVA